MFNITFLAARWPLSGSLSGAFCSLGAPGGSRQLPWGLVSGFCSLKPTVTCKIDGLCIASQEKHGLHQSVDPSTFQ